MTETLPARPIFVPPGTPPHELLTDDLRPVLLVATARRRAVGRLLDVCAVVTSFVLIVAVTTFLPTIVLERVPNGLIAVLLTATGVAAVTSFVVLRIGLLAWWGCTAGQRIAGLRVVEYPEGTPLRGWRRAVRRWFIMRGRSSLGPIDDALRMLSDRRLRQCDHDIRAGTVVIRTPSATAPVLPAPGLDGASFPPDPTSVRRREAIERNYRIALGAVLGVAMLAVVAAVAVEPVRARITGSKQPPFKVDTFYENEPHFQIRSPTGRSGVFDRTAGTVRDGTDGCLAAGVDDKVRDLLGRLRCQGQIEAAFTTSDGVVRISGHVLRFPDAAAASRVAGLLRWSDVRFVPGGPVDPPGQVRDGLLDYEDRYVVVTSVVAPKGPGTPEQARNALILLHVSTVNTIVWL